MPLKYNTSTVYDLMWHLLNAIQRSDMIQSIDRW